MNYHDSYRDLATKLKTYSTHIYQLPPNKNVYLLDRNVVFLIKSANSGKIPSDIKHKAMIKILRCLDDPKNTFSPLPSVIEGQKGRRESMDEIIEVTLKEADAIGRYFKNAQTDSVFLKNTVDQLRNTSDGLKEANIQEVMDFLDSVYASAHQEIRSKYVHRKRYALVNVVLDTAIEKCIDPAHPIVITCISMIHCGTEASGVLKMDKNSFNSYNAANDVLAIARIGRLKAAGMEGTFGRRRQWGGINLRFLTLDSSLRKLQNLFEIAPLYAQKHGQNNVRIAYNMTFKRKLFPKLSDKGVQDLATLIKSKQADFRKHQ